MLQHQASSFLVETGQCILEKIKLSHINTENKQTIDDAQCDLLLDAALFGKVILQDVGARLAGASIVHIFSFESIAHRELDTCRLSCCNEKSKKHILRTTRSEPPRLDEAAAASLVVAAAVEEAAALLELLAIAMQRRRQMCATTAGGEVERDL